MKNLKKFVCLNDDVVYVSKDVYEAFVNRGRQIEFDSTVVIGDVGELISVFEVRYTEKGGVSLTGNGTMGYIASHKFDGKECFVTTIDWHGNDIGYCLDEVNYRKYLSD